MGAITRREFLFKLPLIGAAGCAFVSLPGCRSVPAASVVALAARGIGGAAGLVLNDCRLSDETRRAVVRLMERVVAVTPGAGETLTATWISAAKAHVDSLVAAGKVKPLVGAIALAAFAVIVRAYALLELRYPHVKFVRELTCAAVDGFAAGFLATFRPDGIVVQSYDVEAYNSLSADPGVSALRNLVDAVAQSAEK